MTDCGFQSYICIVCAFVCISILENIVWTAFTGGDVAVTSFSGSLYNIESNHFCENQFQLEEYRVGHQDQFKLISDLDFYQV